MIAWKRSLERQLSEPGAPGALTLGSLSRAASIARGEQVPDTTLHAWIQDAVARSRLVPVARGVYLNEFTSPPGRLPDAVPHLRRDAVISLHTALDEAGAYNNPPVGVTAVVPLDSGSTRPRVGRVNTALGPIYVRAVPRRILEAGEIEDRLNLDHAISHPRATAEKALLDWIYLANSPRSTLAPPGLHDVDLDVLDPARLKRLATAMGLADVFARWKRGQFILRVRSPGREGARGPTPADLTRTSVRKRG